MAAIRFLAFGAYVRKAFANNEHDDGDAPNGRAGQRVRLWSATTPHGGNYLKTRTLLLDLTRHPGLPRPNFLAAAMHTIDCDAPGFTAIGAGALPHVSPFATKGDYVNRIYLSETFWNGLPANLQPTFPPVAPTSTGTRKVPNWPLDYEFESYAYSSDDPTADKQNRRYLGFYVEVIGLVSGTTWDLRVYNPGKSSFRLVQLDFNDAKKHDRRANTVDPMTQPYGAVYLDSSFAASKQLELPKLPPGEGRSEIPELAAIQEILDRADIPGDELLDRLAAREDEDRALFEQEQAQAQAPRE